MNNHFLEHLVPVSAGLCLCRKELEQPREPAAIAGRNQRCASLQTLPYITWQQGSKIAVQLSSAPPEGDEWLLLS